MGRQTRPGWGGSCQENSSNLSPEMCCLLPFLLPHLPVLDLSIVHQKPRTWTLASLGNSPSPGSQVLCAPIPCCLSFLGLL